MNTGTLTVLFAEVEFVTTIATEVMEKIRQADQAFVKTVNGIFEGMMKKK